jgi:hypothetical protein
LPAAAALMLVHRALTRNAKGEQARWPLLP